MSTFEVFYDGECPLCLREIRLLTWLDRHDRLQCTDIAAPGFDANALGMTQDELMARIHGRRADGTFVEGVEVFRQLYTAVGFGPLVAITRLRPIAWALDHAYHWFAKNRLSLTGRCTKETCAL